MGMVHVTDEVTDEFEHPANLQPPVKRCEKVKKITSKPEDSQAQSSKGNKKPDSAMLGSQGVRAKQGFLGIVGRQV